MTKAFRTPRLRIDNVPSLPSTLCDHNPTTSLHSYKLHRISAKRRHSAFTTSSTIPTRRCAADSRHNTGCAPYMDAPCNANHILPSSRQNSNKHPSALDLHTTPASTSPTFTTPILGIKAKISISRPHQEVAAPFHSLYSEPTFHKDRTFSTDHDTKGPFPPHGQTQSSSGYCHMRYAFSQQS